jgi:hypothetical protein
MSALRLGRLAGGGRGGRLRERGAVAAGGPADMAVEVSIVEPVEADPSVQAAVAVADPVPE